MPSTSPSFNGSYCLLQIEPRNDNKSLSKILSKFFIGDETVIGRGQFDCVLNIDGPETKKN